MSLEMKGQDEEMEVVEDPMAKGGWCHLKGQLRGGYVCWHPLILAPKWLLEEGLSWHQEGF